MIETTVVEPPVIEEEVPIPTKEAINLTLVTGKKNQIGSMIEHLGKEVDDDDQLELITSLNKIIGKNKKVRSLEGCLKELTEKLQSTKLHKLQKQILWRKKRR